MKYAIVGCGLIGRKRCAALPPGSVLVAACDLKADRAAALAGNGRAYTDYRQIIRESEAEVIIVATINSELAVVAAEAIGAGKHVLLEKPCACSSAEVATLIQLSLEHGVLVRSGFNHRYHPALLKARELFEAGELGPLMFLRGRYGHGGRIGYDKEWRADPALSGGGELIDQGIHLIDLARWFLGDFTQVEGHVATYFWEMPVEDNAFLSLRTASGATAWLHASCTEWKNLFSLEIYGKNAKLDINGLGGSYGMERITFHKMLPEMGPPKSVTWEYPEADSSFRAELLAFEKDIALGRSPEPGLAEAKAVLEIVEVIYQRGKV